MSSRSKTASITVSTHSKGSPRHADLPFQQEKGSSPDLDAALKQEGRTEYPEGGWVGWATVAGAWLIQFTGFGYSNAFGVYQDFYVREYLSQRSSSQISWIGSTQLFLTMSIGIVTGRLFDRGYFYHMIVSGSMLLSFSLFMLSLCQPHHYYQVFLSHGIGVGIGAGLTYIPSIAVVSHHFHRRRALAMGIVASGSSFGGLVHPIMLNNLFYNSRSSFALGVRASAGMVTGLLVIAIALMRTRLPPRPLVDLLPAARRFSRDVPYVATVAGTTFVSTSIFFPLFYLQLDAIKHGLSPSFAFYSLSILNSASGVGRILPGFFANSIGVMNMIAACVTFCAILIFAMLSVQTVAGVAVFAVLYGFFTGAYVTLIGPTLAVLSEDVSEIGVRMGLSFTFTGLGSLIGTPITGALLTTNYIWWRPTIFSGVVCLAGAVSFTISRLTLGRRRGIPKLGCL